MTGGRRGNYGGTSNASEKGIYLLSTIEEKRSTIWARRKIFSDDLHCNGNAVFSSDLHNYYQQLCAQSRQKAKTGRYVIRQVAEFLAIFKIFPRSERELECGRVFFFNENRVFVTTELEEKILLTMKNFCIMDMEE